MLTYVNDDSVAAVLALGVVMIFVVAIALEVRDHRRRVRGRRG